MVLKQGISYSIICIYFLSFRVTKDWVLLGWQGLVSVPLKFVKFVCAYVNRIFLSDGGHDGAQEVFPLPPLLLSPKVRLRQVLRVKEQVDNIFFSVSASTGGQCVWYGKCGMNPDFKNPSKIQIHLISMCN